MLAAHLEMEIRSGKSVKIKLRNVSNELIHNFSIHCLKKHKVFSINYVIPRLIEILLKIPHLEDKLVF